MGIKGKWEMSFRVFGMILLLIGIIFTVILDFYILQDTIVFLLSIGIFFLSLSIIIGFKLELKLFIEKKSNLLIIMVIFSTIILIFGSLLSLKQSNIHLFLLLSLSNSIVIVSWHYSLSFYRKKKFIFIIGSVAHITISLIIRHTALMKLLGFIGLIPFILITFGIGSIITSEGILYKKKLLKYV